MIAYTKVFHKVIPEIKRIVNIFWLRATEAIALEQKNERVLAYTLPTLILQTLKLHPASKPRLNTATVESVNPTY